MLLFMQKIAIIIPCFNEEKRLIKSHIDYLMEQTTLDVFFANDGSTDRTAEVVKTIISGYKDRCFLLDHKENKGKAATIFTAINEVNALALYDFIGYFDADFSTPPAEIKRLASKVNAEVQFVFGSRILLLNSGIKRKWYRHIIGRTIITLINLKFKLGIYDTQCGAKIFSKEIIRQVFNKPFNTSWLFDVEVFIRLKRKKLLHLGKEIPISNWNDVEGSKLGFKTGFKILKELYTLVNKETI